MCANLETNYKKHLNACLPTTLLYQILNYVLVRDQMLIFTQ